MRKILIAGVVSVLSAMAFPVFALDFDLTLAAADLFRERGSVGYLYWGFYREC